VNRDEAKDILSLFRHGSADADDPQIAEALALAKSDLELARWLEKHCARQYVVREKFRQIAVPAGLKEQIISEHAALTKIISLRQRIMVAATVAMVALIFLTFFLFRPRQKDDTFAVYQNQMAGIALRGYAMDLATNNPASIRAYLAQNRAPADFALPAALGKIEVTGCAIEGWQNAKVSMICFRTGRPLPSGQSSDLWLFVIDRPAMKDAPAADARRFVPVNKLTTATWTGGGKIYFLGIEGDETTLRKYL
jgi:uncharacterized membrane protein YbaN (DUF454 family)